MKTGNIVIVRCIYGNGVCPFEGIFDCTSAYYLS